MSNRANAMMARKNRGERTTVCRPLATPAVAVSTLAAVMNPPRPRTIHPYRRLRGRGTSRAATTTQMKLCTAEMTAAPSTDAAGGALKSFVNTKM